MDAETRDAIAGALDAAGDHLSATCSDYDGEHDAASRTVVGLLGGLSGALSAAASELRSARQSPVAKAGDGDGF